MDSERKQRVADLMARMAAGDEAAVVTLYQEFGPTLASVMRRLLRDFHVEQIDSAELDGLVMDACFALYDCAASWHAQRGAQPWTWAEKRLRALVATFLGMHTDHLDDERAAEMDALAGLPSGPGSEPDAMAVLDAIAARGDQARLLRSALGQVATPRNRAITLEVKVQQAMGDRSPAVTVGRQYDMRPDTVRQVVKRTLDAVRNLAATDAEYAPLADLPFLAA